MLGPEAALEEFAVGLAGAGVIASNGQGSVPSITGSLLTSIANVRPAPSAISQA